MELSLCLCQIKPPFELPARLSRLEPQILSSKWCSVDVQLERLEGVASCGHLAGLIHCVPRVGFSPGSGLLVAALLSVEVVR